MSFTERTSEVMANSTTVVPTTGPHNYFDGWMMNSFKGKTDISTQSFLLLYSLCLSIAFIVCHQFIRKWGMHSVPEPGVAVIVGALISLLTYSVGHSDLATTFDANFFFWYLLPPLIFHAGFSQNRLPFFKNWCVITLFANVGTVVSTVLFGYCIFYLGQANLIVPLSFMECLCFGALVSATDPVSTLSVFADLNVDPSLQAIVYGSSAIDDAVAIVMFRSFEKYIFEEYVATEVFVTIAVYLITSLVVSSVIGVLWGAIAAFIIKHNVVETDNKAIVCFIIGLIYISYFSCTILDMSGIISCIFTAISLRYFLEIGEIIKEEEMKSVTAVLSIFAYFIETLVFFCIGMSAASKSHLLGASEDLSFMGWSIFLAIFSRAASIYPLSYFANYINGYISFWSCFPTCSCSLFPFHTSTDTDSPDASPDSFEDPESKPESMPSQNVDELENQSIDDEDEDEIIAPTYIDMRHQHMIVFAGLRGPIAYAASELFPTESKYYRTVYFATLAIVLSNIFISGSLTPCALNILGIPYNRTKRTLLKEVLEPPKVENSNRMGEVEGDEKYYHDEMPRTNLESMNVDIEDNDEISLSDIIPNSTDNNSTVRRVVNIGYCETSDIEICGKKDDTSSNNKKKCPRAGIKKYSGKHFNICFMNWFTSFERKYIIPAYRCKIK